MKYFFITLTQHDGEHEHVYRFTGKGKTEESVGARMIKEQVYESGEQGHKNSMLSYFDGLTAVSNFSLTETTPEDYEILSKFLSEV